MSVATKDDRGSGRTSRPTAAADCMFPGVDYANTYFKTLDDNAQNLAGALGLETTVDLWNLYLRDADAKEVLKAYVDHRVARFGADESDLDKNHRIIQDTTMRQVMFDPLARKIWTRPDAPKLTDSGVTKVTFYAIVTLWYACELIEAKPALFMPTSRPRANPPVLDTYDLLHAWKLLAYMARAEEKDRVPRKRNPKRNKAAAPVFARKPTAARWASLASIEIAPAGKNPEADPTGGGPQAEGGQQGEEGEQAELALPADDAGDDDEWTFTPGSLTVEDMRQTRAIEEQISSFMPGVKATHASDRPPMSHTQREALLHSLASGLGKLVVSGGAPVPAASSDYGIDADMITAVVQAAQEEALQTDGDDPSPRDPPTEEDATDEGGPPTKGLAQLARDAKSAMRRTSAIPISYYESCGELGLKTDNPVLPGASGPEAVALKPWQVVAAAWMLWQEGLPTRGGLLADGCGLGKTLTALAHIFMNPLRLSPGGDKVVYKPTLVVCPSGVLYGWAKEVARRFGNSLRLVIFYGRRSTTVDVSLKDYVADDLVDLRKSLSELDPTDITTARTLVLTSYSTWAVRTCYPIETDGSDDDVDSREASKGPSETGDPDELDEEDNEESPVHWDDLDDDSRTGGSLRTRQEAVRFLGTVQAELDAEDQSGGRNRRRPAKAYRSLMVGAFARVIADEAHYIKAIRTRNHQSISLLEAQTFWGLTATPIWNRPTDLCGYLVLLYRDSKEKIARLNREAVLKEYRRAGEEPDEEDLSALGEAAEDDGTKPPPYHLLAPQRLAILAAKRNMTAQEGLIALPVIMRMVCLAREMGDVLEISPPGHIETLVKIGQEIPPLGVSTIELKHTPISIKLHRELLVRLVTLANMRGMRKMRQKLENMELPVDPKDLQPEHRSPLTPDLRRRMAHIAFMPRLEVLYQRLGRSRARALDVLQYASTADYGFNTFFRRTTLDPCVLPPSTRLAAAYYLARHCVKLRYLAKILKDQGLFSTEIPAAERPRFIVFTQWPTVRWVVLMFLHALGVEFTTIVAGMTADERAHAADQFNTAGTSVSVLVTSFQTGAVGINIHRQCSRAIFMEPPTTVNGALQAIGRMRRVGQVQEQLVWILSQTGTYDVHVEQSSIAKALPQIAADMEPVLRAAGLGPGADGDDKGLFEELALTRLCGLLGRTRTDMAGADLREWVTIQLTAMGANYADVEDAEPAGATEEQVTSKSDEAKNADAKNSEAKNAEAKDAEAKEADAKEAEAKEADAKEADAKEADAKKAETPATTTDAGKAGIERENDGTEGPKPKRRKKEPQPATSKGDEAKDTEIPGTTTDAGKTGSEREDDGAEGPKPKRRKKKHQPATRKSNRVAK